MPKRTDIKNILIIGSGPIVIGQGAEFDYSGTQACKALREEGFSVVLINSNPATIMTDPEMADRTYIEPITPEFIEKILIRERDDGLQCTLDRCDPSTGACRHDCTAAALPPVEVPKADDRIFVFEQDKQLSAGETWTTPNAIRVTRYAGPTDGNGHLLQASSLIAAELAGATARLEIIALGVQVGAQHRVYFNDVEVGYLQASPACQWSKSVFNIPLSQVRFPGAKGVDGNPPIARINPVKIIVGGQPVCLRFRAASLSVKLMSPIVLIHGTNSNAGFWDRRGFTKHVLNSGGLGDQFLLYDNSISMTTAPRRDNADKLKVEIPAIATEFGVDSIHIVAHSKGGLDTREYLQLYQKQNDSQFKVLSFTTLSTPHNGSALADMAEKREEAYEVAWRISYSNFPAFLDKLNSLNFYYENIFEKPDLGRASLTTYECANFNAQNIENLPGGIFYNTETADADCNGDAKITLYAGEWEDANDESFTAASFGANIAYQFLRWVRTVVVKSEYHTFLGVPINLAVIEAIPGGPFENDLLVTVPSGQGVRSFERLVRSQDRFPTFYCKNHASVCDEDVAARVGPWIVEVEREYGDLRP